MTISCYIAECMRMFPQGKFMTLSLHDLLTGNIKHEMTAEEAEKNMMDEFRRLGGVPIG